MEIRILIFILTLSAVNSNPVPETRVTADRNEYRLLNVIDPTNYKVSLTLDETVFSGTSAEFDGYVEILFRVTNETDIIQIHERVNVTEISLVLANNRTNYIEIITEDRNTTRDIRTLTLLTNLTINQIYLLVINYTGLLDVTDMQGFYRSSYVNANGVTRYLVTTQFQPDHARKAFPCFDEPEYKATFDIDITYPRGLTALSNTPNISLAEVGNIYEKQTFTRTPIMSTYLIAFIVSDFTCSGEDEIQNSIPHQVCSRESSESTRGLANQYSPPLMHALEKVAGSNYSSQQIGKVDQIAVPDFSAGAMENWGLVTYREMALLWNETESSNVDKQRILTIIAHEFAHMWFGNLVTTRWWDTLFLNEGFASYFEYFTPAQISQLEVTEGFELAKQFVVDKQQSVFLSDGTITSRSLSADASTSAEIWGKFSPISYLKGASVIRMVENFMGTDNFIAGIQTYLSTNQLSTTVPSDLWVALQSSLPASTLPHSLTLEHAMDNWINLPGYPVITVNISGNDVLLSQKRFLYEGSDSTEWYVPISYTVSNNTAEFENVRAKIWLVPGNIRRLPNVLDGSDWIILNNQESAYYRVNYDSTLWDRIKNVLYNNHTAIDVLNRAQIVDDALNLARAGLLRYPEAFSIIGYLRNETEYYPWHSALVGFDYLLRTLGENSTVGYHLNTLLLDLLEGVRNTVSFDSLNENNQIYTLKLILILGRLCRLRDNNCVANATALFRNHVSGSSIDKNLKSISYCNGLRHSDNSYAHWNFLWNKFRSTTLSSEHITILSALGCTTNETILNNYLELSITPSSGIRQQDIARVWSSVITSNPGGEDVAFNFLQENYLRISDYFAGATTLLTNIAARFTTQEQIEKLEQFANITDLDISWTASATAALTSARGNLQFANVTVPQLEEHFGVVQTTTDSAIGIFATISTTIILAILTLCV